MTSDFKTSLQKHKRYGDAYGKNEVYWGLGIECEAYLESATPKKVPAEFFLTKHKPERYSVNYYTSYKKEAFESAISKFDGIPQLIPLPFLLNAHAFQKCDSLFQHKTLFKKGTPPNPEFSGQTIFQLCEHVNPSYFKEQYGVSFVFDGDSIEIMTQHFYKTTIEKVLQELELQRKLFLMNVREVFDKYSILHGGDDIRWMKQNHGFAIMATNPDNLAIFNNGTYHINITLPTKLNHEGKIENWELFEEQHKQYIRLIQWMEPIFVAVFGTSDPFTCMDPTLFSQGSQRGAMSRYIGLGTFDTKTMKKGKLLTMDISGDLSHWYSEYHETSGYQPLKKIGLDINFNKHWNHGVEIRFFDWFPETRLKGLLKLLIYLGDVSLTNGAVKDPLCSSIWKRMLIRCIQKGSSAGVTKTEAYAFSELLHETFTESKSVSDFFADILCKLMKRWKEAGPCSKHFMEVDKKRSCAIPKSIPLTPPPIPEKIKPKPKTFCTIM